MIQNWHPSKIIIFNIIIIFIIIILLQLLLLRTTMYSIKYQITGKYEARKYIKKNSVFYQDKKW